MNKVKQFIWFLGAILFFVWLVGVSLSITVLPYYLIYRMVMVTGFRLWGFVKILSGSLICYFGFLMIAFEQYMLLMTPNWHTE
jgi:hypothetical protein